MAYNQQYLVAAQMGHQQVQIQQQQTAEIAHQQVIWFLAFYLAFFANRLARCFLTNFSAGK